MLLNQGFEYRETVGPAAAGRSVLEYLAERYPHSTQSQWSERLIGGEVLLDGKTARADEALRKGQVLVWHRPAWQEPEAPLDFEVVFDDQDLLAVSKPRGLPTVAGGGFLAHTLQWQVNARFPGAAPMHRLDRATSGLVLFARSGPARAQVGEAWRRGDVTKVYRALVQGEPKADVFDVDVPIGPVKSVFAADPKGKHAHSRVTVIARREGEALVDVEISTGRPHQIRIHLAAAGHALVGEPLYGEGGLPVTAARPGDGGFLLHARRLVLPRPLSGERLELDCPPPADLC